MQVPRLNAKTMTLMLCGAAKEYAVNNPVKTAVGVIVTAFAAPIILGGGWNAAGAAYNGVTAPKLGTLANGLTGAFQTWLNGTAV